MAGTVFFSVTMSLDGFIAPEELTDEPYPPGWLAQWMELQQWIIPLRFFRENLKLGDGGEEGRDDDILRETFARTGASGWVGACSTSASMRGPRRRRSTRPSSC